MQFIQFNSFVVFCGVKALARQLNKDYKLQIRVSEILGERTNFIVDFIYCGCNQNTQLSCFLRLFPHKCSLTTTKMFTRILKLMIEIASFFLFKTPLLSKVNCNTIINKEHNFWATIDNAISIISTGPTYTRPSRSSFCFLFLEREVEKVLPQERQNGASKRKSLRALRCPIQIVFKINLKMVCLLI